MNICIIKCSGKMHFVSHPTRDDKIAIIMEFYSYYMVVRYSLLVVLFLSFLVEGSVADQLASLCSWHAFNKIHSGFITILLCSKKICLDCFVMNENKKKSNFHFNAVMQCNPTVLVNVFQYPGQKHSCMYFFMI